jgi:hypothetical protein
MIGFTTETIFQARMSIGDLNSTMLHITVRVRDMLGTVTELDIQSISVVPNMIDISALISVAQSTVNISSKTSKSLLRILYGGNDNDVCQCLISVSQILNNMAKNSLLLALKSMSTFS